MIILVAFQVILKYYMYLFKIFHFEIYLILVDFKKPKKILEGGNMKNKKIFIILLAFIMVFSILAACSNEKTDDTSSTSDNSTTNSNDSNEGKESKDEVRVITAMMSQSRNTEGFQKMVKKLEDEENIKLDIQIIPDDQYHNLLQLKLNTGEAPDLIDYNAPAIFGLADAESQLMDLTSQTWTSNLINPSNVTYNDKVYAFPFSELAGFQAIVYNEQVFDDNNIEVPSDWDGVLAACETLKAAGVTPFLVPKDLWVPQIWMTSGYSRALGQDKAKEFADNLLANEDGFTNHPELAQVLDTYFEIHKLGYVNEDYLTATIDKGYGQVASGEIAMLFGSTGMVNSLLTANPDAKINMMNPKMPYEDKNLLSTANYTVSFSVNKSTENLDVIEKIFNLWATPEYGDLYFAERPGYPAFAEINGGELPSYVVNLYKDFIETGKTVPEMNALLTPLQPLYNSVLWVYYADAPAKGTTGEEVLAMFQKDVAKLLTENDYPGWEE